MHPTPERQSSGANSLRAASPPRLHDAAEEPSHGEHSIRNVDVKLRLSSLGVWPLAWDPKRACTSGVGIDLEHRRTGPGGEHEGSVGGRCYRGAVAGQLDLTTLAHRPRTRREVGREVDAKLGPTTIGPTNRDLWTVGVDEVAPGAGGPDPNDPPGARRRIRVAGLDSKRLGRSRIAKEQRPPTLEYNEWLAFTRTVGQTAQRCSPDRAVDASFRRLSEGGASREQAVVADRNKTPIRLDEESPKLRFVRLKEQPGLTETCGRELELEERDAGRLRPVERHEHPCDLERRTRAIDGKSDDRPAP